ncbi:unnamed protein product [Miscanthus lutarioriparius]|uniref:Uncharacterized protein n=1 Tax=Miscanthus lutarioriparius TaxID=422564 RepID=A0A811RLS3_9POAL|nr:unnamed protein product [Miscanthus lutarioriparius]
MYRPGASSVVHLGLFLRRPQEAKSATQRGFPVAQTIGGERRWLQLGRVAPRSCSEKGPSGTPRHRAENRREAAGARALLAASARAGRLRGGAGRLEKSGSGRLRQDWESATPRRRRECRAGGAAPGRGRVATGHEPTSPGCRAACWSIKILLGRFWACTSYRVGLTLALGIDQERLHCQKVHFCVFLY